MEIKSSVLLDQIFNLWSSSREKYRDSMIQVGRLLQKFVIARLREADGLNEKDRRKEGLTREASTEEAAERLQVKRAKINELIRTAATVDLLSDSGDMGNLSYTSVRWFRLAIERKKGILRRSKSDDSEKTIEASDREKWIVKESYVDPRIIFQTAAREGWNSEQVKIALNPFSTCKHIIQPNRYEENDCMGTPIQSNPLEIAKNSSPRDLAELILSMIRNSQDPNWVLEIVNDQANQLSNIDAILRELDS